ncbi:MAG: diguanylate cyclase [Oscillospiraceae bacterium]|nr:diguanylate cyclase [Oscillospiraceae bacterium]
MKKRLLFGVVIAESEHLVQKRLLKGAIAQAFSIDVDLAIFSITVNHMRIDAHQQSECNIFQYMNFSMLDGILYARHSIHSIEQRKTLDALFIAHKIPVLVLDDETSPFPFYMPDDRAAMCSLTTHLIREHGLTDLICLTGQQNNRTAEERALGFRDALEQHGLVFSPEQVIYGDYWEHSAQKLGTALVNGERPLPQGVVCGNDPMAKFLCETLLDGGIHIPEQISVVGYDAVLGDEHTVISITSYVRKNFSLGVSGIAKLYEIVTGKSCALVPTERIELITGKSCACNEDIEFLRHQLRENSKKDQFDTLYRMSNMAIRLTGKETLDECLEVLRNFVYMIRNCKEYYLCLCEDWEGGGAVEHPDEYRKTGFPEHMLLKLMFNEKENAVVTKPFPSSKMLPMLFEDREQPAAYYFTPLHHNDRFFGLSVLSFGDQPDSYDPLYCSWLQAVNIALEFVRMQNYLKRFNNRIYLSSIRDSLTGLYNKEGHLKFLTECFDAAQREHRRFLLLFAQCDGVRQINETYGHSEGDSAITILANALNNSCSTYERCSRIEDACFSIIGYQDYDVDSANRFINAITGYLEHYNQSSLKPYKITASFGVFCDYLMPETSLQDVLAYVQTHLDENRSQRQSEKSSPYYREFVDLRERIYSNPQEDWSIDTMCQNLILSRGYFQKLYTRCFGISFTQDVINSRIELSKRLLSSTELTITEIADRSGYSNYVHFMHQFKKIVGITPTEYRKRKQQSDQ